MPKIVSKKKYEEFEEKIAILQSELLNKESYIHHLESIIRDLTEKIAKQKQELKNSHYIWR